MTGVIVACNTMEKNTVGLFILAGTHVEADTFVVLYNNFVGNTSYGLQNNNALPVTAENNWWGDASGPTHSTNPGGTGDAVSNGVDFTPWSFTPDPCETKTLGFWKNHPGSVDAILDAYPHPALGSHTVINLTQAIDILESAKAKNAYDMLTAQLLAAELNKLHLTHISVPSGLLTPRY